MILKIRYHLVGCGKKIGDEYIDFWGRIKILKRTDMHHIKYHEDDFLKDAIELCLSCHAKETWKTRKKS